tara:strand:+ start:20431 stop:22566 length:2136 start_codon:yes stop_codon:yes gene_type:complete
MLQKDYNEKVYAGVLGKVIGVYAGKPFEGWEYDKIEKDLGEITDYVHTSERYKKAVGNYYPIVAVDDDISGTFTFIRALEDHGITEDISPEDIGNTWLNYLIEDKSVLWWGGMGHSTEHTAFLRLKSGIPAPQSGSKELNGKVVSEQIGAQIFIDGWGMVCPGDPEKASEFAKKAGSVSHDGEAVYGAQVVAAMEALAFIEEDTNKILDESVKLIPESSIIYQMIADIRDWHAGDDEWRDTFKKIKGKYGYDKYGGVCHIVPNHGLIINSILHADDDFSEAIKIVNTSGWDTDCNSGNVGCYMGIKLGLEGIDGSEDSYDWRGPVADRIYMPTADGGRGISDCVTEANMISRMGRILNDEEVPIIKNGAKFNFDYPGSLQGFTVDLELTTSECEISNCAGNSRDGDRSLEFKGGKGVNVITSPVFIPTNEEFNMGYGLHVTPKIYSGQKISAGVMASKDNGSVVSFCLVYKYYGQDDELVCEYGEKVTADPGQTVDLSLKVKQHNGRPVCQVGLLFEGEPSTVYLDFLTWDGEPDYIFDGEELVGKDWGQNRGKMYQHSWINSLNCGEAIFYYSRINLTQNEGPGLVLTGSRDWKNYYVEADMAPHLAKAVGVCARVQGLKRYYSLQLVDKSKLQIIKMFNQESVLASVDFDWEFDNVYQIRLDVKDNKLTGSINGEVLIEGDDSDFEDGGIALVLNEGRSFTNNVKVQGI